jgi:hypothetical protein
MIDRRDRGGRIAAPGQRRLAVPESALGIWAFERQTGEELCGHAAATARVEMSAGLAGPCTLRLAKLAKQCRIGPDACEAAWVTHVAGSKAVVDCERARIDVPDRVDETDDASGSAEVEAGQRLSVGGEVEEGIPREYIVSMPQ